MKTLIATILFSLMLSGCGGNDDEDKVYVDFDNYEYGYEATAPQSDDQYSDLDAPPARETASSAACDAPDPDLPDLFQGSLCLSHLSTLAKLMFCEMAVQRSGLSKSCRFWIEAGKLLEFDMELLRSPDDSYILTIIEEKEVMIAPIPTLDECRLYRELADDAGLPSKRCIPISEHYSYKRANNKKDELNIEIIEIRPRN